LKLSKKIKISDMSGFYRGLRVEAHKDGYYVVSDFARNSTYLVTKTGKIFRQFNGHGGFMCLDNYGNIRILHPEKKKN
jgi:hypothetical protein